MVLRLSSINLSMGLSAPLHIMRRPHISTPEEIAQMESRLVLSQKQFDDDDGGLLEMPVEEVTAAQFNSHAVALRTKDPLKYAAIQRQLFKTFVSSQMIQGLDYGVIPGTEKPALYKAGAEKLASFFNLRILVNNQESVQDWDKPFFSFDYQAEVRDMHGKVLAQCEANCNSYETKYRYRNVKKAWARPEEIAAAVSSKRMKQDGQYVEYIVIPNDKIFDQVNTIKKMSQKRAVVGAVLLACNASAFFGNMEAEMSHADELPLFYPTWEAEIVEPTPQAEPEPTSQPNLNPNREAILAIARKFGTDGTTIKTIIKGLGKEDSSELNPDELKQVQLQLMLSWSVSQGVFEAPQHAANSLKKLQQENPNVSMLELAQLWMQKVEHKAADLAMAE